VHDTVGAAQRHRITADGAGSAPFPLTWSQRHMYEVVALPLGWAAHNLSARVPVPDGTTTGAVLTALRELVERHDSLRTTVAAGPDGRPCQWLLGPVTLVVEEHELPSEGLDTFAGRVALSDVGHDGLPPCRADLVTRHGRPHTVVLTVSHLAVDGTGLQLVAAELAARLAGHVPPAPALTPRDRVAYEGSPAGRERSRRSLRFAQRQLAQAPTVLLPENPAGEDPASRFWVGRLASPALTAAMRALPVLRSTTAAPALVGVLAALLAGRAGAPSANVVLICGNRFVRGQQDHVGSLFMPVPLTVPVPQDAGLLATLAESRTRVMRAHLSCEFDPVDLWALEAQERARRGRDLTLPAAVNVHDAAVGGTDNDVAVDAAVARLRVGTTAVDWQPLGGNDHLPRFYVDLVARDGVLNLFLRLDTRLFDRVTAARLVHGVEAVLVELLERDLTVREALELAGLRQLG
jgi:hypothetical protein